MSTTTTTDRLWGVRDVAAYLDVPVQTVYQWRSTGYGPPGGKVGRHVKYLPEDVRAWFTRQRTGTG